MRKAIFLFFLLLGVGAGTCLHATTTGACASS